MNIERVLAVADKEWRLNFRFPLQHFITTAATPIKSAILMYLIYRGLLKGDLQLGILNRENFKVFVIVGTICHNLFVVSLNAFTTKMVLEKYWMTITATLASPASIFEVVWGYVLGSAGLSLAFGLALLTLVCVFFSISVQVFLLSFVVILLIILLGFGMGIVGAIINLVWEGKGFLFEYGTQALVFLSCFYYPIETLPKSTHFFVQYLPTYVAADIIQHLYVFGSHPELGSALSYVAFSAAALLIFPAILLDYSVKRWGIVGY